MAIVSPVLLSLPIAFTLLGWSGGVLCLTAAGLVTFYSYNLLSIVLEHFAQLGRRHLRFRDMAHDILVIACSLLGGQNLKYIYLLSRPNGSMQLYEFIAMFGGVTLIMAQMPSFHSLRHINLISLILCLTYSACTTAGAIHIGHSNKAPKREYTVTGEGINRIFGVFNAISIISTSYGNGIIPEIQATIASPVTGKMFKGLLVCYSVVISTFFSVAISGYWAFGNQAQASVLSNLIVDGVPLLPKWFLLIIYLSTLVQLCASTLVHMAPKRSGKSKGQSSGSSRSRTDPNSPAHYGIHINDNYERERWDELVTKNIIPSRFLDQSVTQELRINEEVVTALHNGGLFKLLGTPRPTYRELVLEFLSTLRVIGEPDITSMHFRLRGNDYWMPVGELLGYLTEGRRMYEDLRMDTRTWWWRLTQTTTPPEELPRFDSKNAKAALIRNPILRFLQLLMRWSMYGRGDAGVINKNELELLWGCVTGRRPDLGKMIAEYLIHKATHPRGNDIAFGGLITAIADCAEVPYDDLEPVPGSNRIDYDMLMNMKLFQMDRRGRRYWSVGPDHIPYDATPLITPWSINNYSMSSPDHRALMSRDPPSGGFMHAFTPTSTIIDPLTAADAPVAHIDYEVLNDLQVGFGGVGQPNIEQFVPQPGPDPGNRRRRHDDAGHYGSLETQINELSLYTHDFRHQYDQNWAVTQQHFADIEAQMAAERKLAAIRHWEMTNYFRQMQGLPPLPHPDMPSE